jgi:hypothetical protein
MEMSKKIGRVQQLLKKSQESAILAVDIYNKPATKFRSYGFIILMTVAWTSFFHAIFERKKIKYFYRKPDSQYFIYIDGEKKAWDLSKCCDEYFVDKNSPIKKNLDFFVALRNKIEHRFLPSLDFEICGECQAFLQNFEKLIIQEFGEEYSLNESLSIPLQLLSINPEWKNRTLKELQGKNYQIVKKYIDTYRQSLDDSVWQSSEFSFRVFLVPQIGSNPRTSACAIEFVHYDPTKPEEMEKYEKIVAFIKEKQVPVLNPGKFKAGDVSEAIHSKLGMVFNASYHHAQCWKYYKIRPENGSPFPDKTEVKYCQYDATHKDYVYTQEWIDFLISELSDINKRKDIFYS